MRKVFVGITSLCMFVLFFCWCADRDSKTRIDTGKVLSLDPGNEIKMGEEDGCKEMVLFAEKRKPTLKRMTSETMRSLALDPLTSQCNTGKGLDGEVYRYVFRKDSISLYLAVILKRVKGVYYLETRWVDSESGSAIKRASRNIGPQEWSSAMSVLENSGFWDSNKVVEKNVLAESVHSGVCFVEAYKNKKYNFVESLDDEEEKGSSGKLNDLCRYLFELGMSEMKTKVTHKE